MRKWQWSHTIVMLQKSLACALLRPTCCTGHGPHRSSNSYVHQGFHNRALGLRARAGQLSLPAKALPMHPCPGHLQYLMSAGPLRKCCAASTALRKYKVRNLASHAGPSRADTTDDWGASRKFAPSSASGSGLRGFEDRSRSGGFSERTFEDAGEGDLIFFFSRPPYAPPRMGAPWRHVHQGADLEERHTLFMLCTSVSVLPADCGPLSRSPAVRHGRVKDMRRHATVYLSPV